MPCETKMGQRDKKTKIGDVSLYGRCCDDGGTVRTSTIRNKMPATETNHKIGQIPSSRAFDRLKERK